MVLLLGGVVFFVNWIVVLIFIRAEREETFIGIGELKHYDTLLEDFIFGVDSIRACGKIDKNR